MICACLFIFTVVLAWAGVSFDMLGQIAGFVVGNLALASVVFATPYLDFKLPFADRGRWPLPVGEAACVGMI